MPRSKLDDLEVPSVCCVGEAWCIRRGLMLSP